MTNPTQYLFKRGHSWYFKRAVPKDLLDALGKDQIVEALHTRDLHEAQSRRWERMEYWEQHFAQLRGAHRPDKTMSPREVFTESLDYLRASKAKVPPSSQRGSGGGEELTEFEVRQELLLQRAIAEHGEDEEGRPAAMSPIQQAQWDALQVYLTETEGKSSSAVGDSGLSLSEAAERYLGRAEQNTDSQTIRQHGATLRRLTEFVSDKPLVKLTRSDVGKFIGLLETFSSSWGKSPKDAERSLEELAQLYANRGKPLSDNTLNRHLSAIRNLWRWAVSTGEVEGDDPTVGLFRKAKAKASREKTYKPFNREELLHLFTDKLPADHALLEVCLVGLYSGMRLGEIVRLSWEDVRTDEGVTFFDINQAKSEAGIRRVPVHRDLHWLLERRTSGGWLWPSLVGNNLATVADRTSKKFRHFKTTKGFKSSGKVFHSFRKSFISSLARAGVQEAEIAQVVGHEHNQITFSVYNPYGFPLSQCKRVVEQFKIEGLTPSETVRRSLSSRRAFR